ncbi:MAG: hypothetical protein M1822_007469 [Bathelium mastoideum]|nr:MAG: hypothetical protein M1822_007469 [Bathelium mastoideum]
MAHKHEYILPRDFEESVRLTAQHYLWTQHQGYHIHPSVNFPKSEDIQVADIACGHCLWLLDAEASTRDAWKATWTGFDISSAQFPKAASLPSNVSLRTLDIYDIPSELHEKFDLVHVRMLGFGVRDNDPLPVLRNLFALLKPGGWLQWDEGDHDFDQPEAVPGTSIQRILELDKAIRASLAMGGFTFKWLGTLSDSFRSAGFREVVEDKHPIKRTAMKYWTELQLQTFATAIRMMAQNPEQDNARREAVEKILEKFPAAIAEAKDGGAFSIWPKVVLGKKM